MTRRTDGSAPAAAPREPVLVAGGTGFLGAALTRRLLADGVRVRVLARSRAKAKPLADLGAQITIGDITDQAAVRADHAAHMDRARSAALARDGYACQVCGTEAAAVGTHLWRQPVLLPSYRAQNLTSLCGPCHEAAHAGLRGPASWI